MAGSLSWFNRLRSAPTAVREMIGRSVQGVVQLWSSRRAVKSVDETRPDYAFWDRFRRGKAEGYALGGLFGKPITQILASWELGRGFTPELAEAGDPKNPEDPRTYTNTALQRFAQEIQALLATLEEDKLALGDQFLIVNPDATLSVASPETVDVERNPLDYREVTGYTLTTKLGEFTIVDEYRLAGRTILVRRGDREVSRQTFANLIGRLPVVHLANEPGTNEVFGHPLYESLLPALAEYDDVAFKMLDGVKLLGNPIPSIEGLDDITQVQNLNDTAEPEEYTDLEGNTETRTLLRFDKHAAFLIGKGGSLEFKGPATGFTADTRDALKSLFLLILDHTRIPEFLWGGAIASSKASAETQLPPFVTYVESRQRQLEAPLLALFDIWLRIRRLTDPRLVIDTLAMRWAPLVGEDEELELRRLEFAKSHSLITDETALEKLDLVEDAEQEVKEAQAEAKARQEEFERRLDEEMRRAGQTSDEGPPARRNGIGSRQPALSGAAA
jgi:hypothetical protein